MTEPLERPVPLFPEPDTEPFWTATRLQELRYQRCDNCGRIVFYPRGRCPHCGSDRLRWLTSGGRGTIYTFTVIRRHSHPFFRARTPYVLAYVDLDEGFRILTEVAADPDRVAIGQRVTLCWEDHETISVPMFRPDSG
jgi:hypothetical protein